MGGRARSPGVRKGNVIAFGARDPSGIERDRERVVVAFEVQDAASASGSAHELCQARAQGRAGGHGPHARRRRRRSPPGVLPKTSSGKLQRAKTRELYEDGALLGRTAKGDASKLELAKHAATSQLSYFKLAVLGGRKKKD